MAKKQRRHGALALLEFATVASGILASDLMVKRAPIALLRCGTVHPGRYLVLVGGAPLNEEFAQAIGADAYCRDAAVAVETAKELVSARRAA